MHLRILLMASMLILLSREAVLAQANGATECGTAGCIDPQQRHLSLGDGTNVGPGSVTGTDMGPQSDDANRVGNDNGGTAGGSASNPGPSGGGY
jgi:hypothetical protein